MDEQITISQKELTQLNQDIYTNYGSRLVISKVANKQNKIEINLDYHRVIHILDSTTNTVFVRAIKFPQIFEGEIDLRKGIKLPLDEINKTIDNNYIELRTNMAKGIICNKKIILPLIRSVPLFTAFLNKFNEIISALVYEGTITKNGIQERINTDKHYKRYFDVIVKSNYGMFDKVGNLNVSEKLKVLHKDVFDKNRKIGTKEVIDEVMFNVIKDNYDYIVHHLGLRMLRIYVNVLSCLNYIATQNNIKTISMKFNDFLRVYNMFYGNILEFKLAGRINQLASAGLINKNKNTINWLREDILSSSDYC